MTKIGYCSTCQQNVLLTREKMNIILAIILFCTCVGFVIYLIIYLSKPENRCVHCGMQITTSTISAQPTQQLDNQTQDNSGNYCPLCGVELDIKNLEFCPNCGGNLHQ